MILELDDLFLVDDTQACDVSFDDETYEGLGLTDDDPVWWSPRASTRCLIPDVLCYSFIFTEARYM